jgi:hypothetical protein
LYKRAITLILMTAVLAGCGGGKEPTDTLFTLHSGTKWTYQFSGTVSLPPAQGGGTQTVQAAQSTVTFEVASATAKDAANNVVNILDRKLDLVLLDGRHVKGDFRLYVTQDSALGIFVHGFNNAAGDTVDPTNDKFVPANASPPAKFLYLPNPATGGTSISYVNPLGLPVSSGYTLQIGIPIRAVTVPAGHFPAKPVAITENFSSFTLSPADLTPGTGIIDGVLNATMPDGTAINGVILLTSVKL